jgi:hypothetical protein
VASTNMWWDILAALLGAGLAWATQLMAQLAVVHGLAESGYSDTEFADALPAFVSVVLEQPLQRDRVAAVGATATGLADVAAAIVKLPNACSMAGVAAECCCRLAQEVAAAADKTELSPAHKAELLEAAKPAVMGALQAAATVADNWEPSSVLYGALQKGLFQSLPRAASHAWCLELLTALHKVLLPSWLRGRSQLELRRLSGLHEAQELAAEALKLASGNTLWRGRSGELRAVLLRYVLDNPWLPGTAWQTLATMVQQWPGCLDQPSGAWLGMTAAHAGLHAGQIKSLQPAAHTHHSLQQPAMHASPSSKLCKRY